MPKEPDKDDLAGLWLALLAAETPEDVERIAALEVPIMTEAIAALTSVQVKRMYEEMERLRLKAKMDEALVIDNVRKEVTAEVTAKWKKELARKDDELARKDDELARKDAEIARLREALNHRQP